MPDQNNTTLNNEQPDAQTQQYNDAQWTDGNGQSYNLNYTKPWNDPTGHGNVSGNLGTNANPQYGQGVNNEGVWTAYSPDMFATYTRPNDKIGSFIYANQQAYGSPKNQQAIYNLVNQGFSNVAGAQAPQINPNLVAQYGGANINTAPDSQLAGAQNSYINDLYNYLNGGGPSAAATQAEQQRQGNIAAQMAMLGSQRGASSPGLGARNAAMAGANANQQATQAATLGRVQEQLGAEQSLASMLGTARGQTQNLSTAQAQNYQQAGMSNQNALNSILNANLQSSTAQNQLSAQQYQNMLTAAMQQNQTDVSNQVAYQQELGQEQLQLGNLNQGQAMAQMQQNVGLGGAGISALGAMAGLAAMASDRRLKTKVTKGSRTVKTFLETLGA